MNRADRRKMMNTKTRSVVLGTFPTGIENDEVKFIFNKETIELPDSMSLPMLMDGEKPKHVGMAKLSWSASNLVATFHKNAIADVKSRHVMNYGGRIIERDANEKISKFLIDCIVIAKDEKK